eukprot:TRINITY_DN1308_c0_g1_i16.p1 TRINITY_DN1308_c0_g1~~TRINITY_DN1308_c0_g1_i16.p1  ORF type:complete len:717 (-),score=84.23 TRINITY_DN1308_c0_g1_i16:273-2423(-)
MWNSFVKIWFFCCLVCLLFGKFCSGLGLFNVAGVLPLTNHPLAQDMVVANTGYLFFCDYVSEQGGFSIQHKNNEEFADSIGQPYKFAFNCQIEDNEGESQRHIDLTNRFIEEGNIDFFVGSHVVFEKNSRNLVNNAERILFQCCIGPDSMYEEQDLKYLFGMQVSNTGYPELFIKEAAEEERNIRTLAVISQLENEFTLTTCAAAVEQAESKGIEVVKNEQFLKTDDTSPEEMEVIITEFVNAARNEGAQAIIGCVQVDDGKLLTSTIHNLEYPLKALFVTTAPWYDSFHEELGRNASIYTLSAGQYHWANKYQDPYLGSNENYVKLYTEYAGEKPNYVGAMASSVMEAYMLAIQDAFVGCDITLSAGNTKKLLYDPRAIDCGNGTQGTIGYDKVYNSLRNFQAQLFTGPVGFNRARRNTAMKPTTIQIQETEDGVLDDVSVLPADIANANLTLPQPCKFCPLTCPDNYVLVDHGYGPCIPKPGEEPRHLVTPTLEEPYSEPDFEVESIPEPVEGQVTRTEEVFLTEGGDPWNPFTKTDSPACELVYLENVWVRPCSPDVSPILEVDTQPDEPNASTISESSQLASEPPIDEDSITLYEECEDILPEDSHGRDCSWYARSNLCMLIGEQYCRKSCKRCCGDVPAPVRNCREVVLQGQCEDQEIVNGGYCLASCGVCCTDVPAGVIPCDQIVQTGLCDDEVIINMRECRLSCGRCQL